MLQFTRALDNFPDACCSQFIMCEIVQKRGTGFIKAIILADKKFWHVLLLRKQVNCCLPGTISTSLIVTLKLFNSFVQIPDRDPDGKDEC